MPKFRRPSLLWPLLLIGLGALLLIQTLGLLPASIWAALAELWPVLLILLGLHLLVSRRSSAGMPLVIVAGVLLVAGALTAAALRAAQLPPGDLKDLVPIPLGAQRLSVEINFQAGRLELGALGSSGSLMQGTAQNGRGETTRQDYTVGGGEGRLLLAQQADPLLAPFLFRRDDNASWNLRLAQHLPLALIVKASSGAINLALNELQLTQLDLTTGLCQTTVTFPTGQPAQARLHTGAGDTALNLPADIGVRLAVRSGLAFVTLPSRLARTGDFYTTPGFDVSKPFLDLELSAGLGNVTIR